MTDSGFLGILIPEEYGGSGLGLKEATVVLEEIHRAGCNAGAAHAQMYIMGSILHSGTKEQQGRYLPRIASGELRLQAFGVTEPNSGTDTLSLQTKATQDANGDWLINGSKMWTSRAEHSDLMLVLARTGDGSEPRGKQLTTFLVDMRDQPGLEIKPVKTMMNHSSTAVFLENVVAKKEDVIGGVGGGFKTILKGMNAERVLIASECIGDGRYFVDRATEYASRARRVWPTNRPESGHPVPHCPSLLRAGGGGVDGEPGRGKVRPWGRHRRRGKHQQASCSRSLF